MEEISPTKKRIHWIDMIRAFSILCIVFGHVIVHSNQLTPVYRYLNTFHVPIFFVISGFLFSLKKETNFKLFTREKFKRIMVPYFIFATLFLVPYYLFGSGTNENLYGQAQNAWWKPILGIIYGNGHENYLQQNSALWFLPCLFVLELIYYGIEKIKQSKFSQMKEKKFYGIIMVIFLLIGYLDYQIEHIRLPWGIDIALVMINFMTLGKLLTIYFNQGKTVHIFVPLICIFIGILGYGLNGEVSCMKHDYGNYWLFIVLAMVSCLGFMLLFSRWKKNEIVEMIGKNTMGILIFHKLFVVVFQTKLGAISTSLKTGNLFIQIMISIVVLLIVTIISLIVTKVVKKTMPFLLGEKRTNT